MAKKASKRAWTAEHVRTVEDACTKENEGGKHCQNLKTDRGRNAAKGIQSRIVTRYPCLTPELLRPIDSSRAK